jgi:hypothetical protein
LIGTRIQFDAAFGTGTVYRSPSYSDETDERGNAMAVLAGLTDRNKNLVSR